MTETDKTSESPWWVYILQCADNTLYTGVTTDTKRRLHEHNHAKLGAKYTKARRPVTLVYQESCTNRSNACQRESAIKQYTRSQKIELIAKHRLSSQQQ